MKRVAVHDGPFHADDVMAAALLQIHHGETETIRTRDEALLAAADIRADVGGRFDHSSGDYDHHYVNSPRRDNGVTYAACGLVWSALGKEIMHAAGSASPEKDAELFDKLMFQDMDRVDTGEGRPPGKAMDASSAIWCENMTWLERQTNENLGEEEDSRFHKALESTARILRDTLHQVATFHDVEDKCKAMEKCLDRLIAKGHARVEAHTTALAAARERIRKAVGESRDGIVEIDMAGMPWQGLIHDMEMAAGRQASHVIEPASGGIWMATAVPVMSGGFVSRIPFPADWAGIRGGVLENASGIKGAVFCHPGLWISGWQTAEIAREACKKVILQHGPRARTP